jgi:hypothetical protein
MGPLKAMIWPYVPAAQTATHTADINAVPRFIGAPFSKFQTQKRFVTVSDGKIYETRRGKLFKKYFQFFLRKRQNAIIFNHRTSSSTAGRLKGASCRAEAGF